MIDFGYLTISESVYCALINYKHLELLRLNLSYVFLGFEFDLSSNAEAHNGTDPDDTGGTDNRYVEQLSPFYTECMM